MDITNQLHALRQELCDKINTTPYGNERGRVKDRAITAIDSLLEALEDIEVIGCENEDEAIQQFIEVMEKKYIDFICPHCKGKELRADVAQSCRVKVDTEGYIWCDDNFTEPEIDKNSTFCGDCGENVNAYTLNEK